MITDINNEDRLVQHTFADHLRDHLGTGVLLFRRANRRHIIAVSSGFPGHLWTCISGDHHHGANSHTTQAKYTHSFLDRLLRSVGCICTRMACLSHVIQRYPIFPRRGCFFPRHGDTGRLRD